MATQPNTVIRILKDIPLDNTYRNTITFSNKSTQESYFVSKTKYTLDKNTYQRLQNGKTRIAIKTDNLFDCNYIMFQNTSFGSKWFYAFITGVEYVNDETTDIMFEIDVMQTWKFDYTVKPSFVEREHSVTDEIGENLVPENLELGEYKIHSQEYSKLFNTYKIVVASTTDRDGNNGYGHAVGRSYSGLYFNDFDTVSEVNDYIELLTTNNKSDSIVSIFMMPTNFVSPLGFNTKTYSTTKKLDNIDGYVPRNKKLFCYPYNFLHVTNLMGVYMDCKYEHFSTENCEFAITCEMSCNPSAIMYPKFYKGVEYNRNEKLTLDGFPQCAYTTDTYKVWLAQNATSSTLSVMSSAMGIGLSAVTGNVAGVVGGAMTIGQTVAKVNNTASQPPQAHGATGGNTLFTMGEHDFWFMKMSIRREFAEIIDGYFDMYGYATHRVKVPNTNSRPHYNYVKTINVNIVGSVPTYDMVKIKSIYDNGITFWKNGNNVGDYSVNNTVS